jgi:hypothetical protein
LIPPPKISYGHKGCRAKVVEVVVYLPIPENFHTSRKLPLFPRRPFFSTELGNRPPPPPQRCFSHIPYRFERVVVSKIDHHPEGETTTLQRKSHRRLGARVA